MSARVLAGPVFDHLVRMTDQRGLFEHALYAEPRPEHGYCVDDVARALVVVTREPDRGERLDRLVRVYLTFVEQALAPDGTCRNRMDSRGLWRDEPTTGDWWGRAVWGLGCAAVGATTPGARGRALAAFRVAAQQRSTHSRTVAFAALGAGAVLGARPDERAARDLLQDCVDVLSTTDREHDRDWRWPEPRLRYANGAVPEALVLAGDVLDRPQVRDRGLDLLGFLLARETRAGRLSVTPVGGRGPSDVGPAFDQQPIEVAAIADACRTAYRVTSDPRWLAEISRAWRWFLGENDSGTPMVDRVGGGGYDGLERGGRNENQGAESTLAALGTAQCAQLVRALR